MISFCHKFRQNDIILLSIGGKIKNEEQKTQKNLKNEEETKIWKGIESLLQCTPHCLFYIVGKKGKKKESRGMMWILKKKMWACIPKNSATQSGSF